MHAQRDKATLNCKAGADREVGEAYGNELLVETSRLKCSQQCERMHCIHIYSAVVAPLYTNAGSTMNYTWKIKHLPLPRIFPFIFSSFLFIIIIVFPRANNKMCGFSRDWTRHCKLSSPNEVYLAAAAAVPDIETTSPLGGGIILLQNEWAKRMTAAHTWSFNTFVVRRAYVV